VELHVDAYDKALVIKVKGDVTVEDIKTFDEELPDLYKEFGLILISFDHAKVQNALLTALINVRAKHGFNKDRLMFVSKSHLQVDHSSVRVALESINTSDALRLGDFIAAKKEMKRLEKELLEQKIAYANVLRRAASAEEKSEPLTPEEERMLRRTFEDRVKKVQFLHRVVGGQIALMKKTQFEQLSTDDSNAIDSRLKDLKKEALETLQKLGVLA
jgi:hypothetical protein